MNTQQAQNLMNRYRLTHKRPFAQPAYVIAYAVGKKGIAFLEAVTWVSGMYKDNRFADYTGSWQDTMNAIHMYTGVEQ